MPQVWPLSPVHHLPLQQAIEKWRELDADGTNHEMCRYLALHDRFYLLVRLCNRSDLIHPWLYARCREVEANPDGYADIWFREARKSTIITFGGALQSALRDSEITIAIFSCTSKLAKKFVSQLQGELEGNERLKALFPDVLWANPQRDAPSWSQEAGLTLKRATNPKEPTISGHGLIDAMPTGMHYRLRIYDDIVVLETVGSPEQLEKCVNAFKISDNLGVDSGGKVWIIGTRYSFADPYEDIIDRGVALPRVYPGTVDGTLTGKPVFFSQQEWDRRVLTQDEYHASCQLLCNPIAGQNRMFDISKLQVYEILPAYLNIYIMVDPARSRKKDSANTAMVVLGIDRGGNLYLLDGFNHKMDLMERWDRMVQLWETWRAWPGTLSIKVGYERFGAIADMDYFDKMRRDHGPHFEIVELEWPSDGTQSKTDRVQRLTPYIAGKRFYIPFETDEDHLTKRQRRMISHPHRIAQRITRVDGNKMLYDLTEQFKAQLDFFPFGNLKDLPDAASRIMDMEPRNAAADSYTDDDIGEGYEELIRQRLADPLRGFKEREGEDRIWEPRWDEL